MMLSKCSTVLKYTDVVFALGGSVCSRGTVPEMLEWDVYWLEERARLCIFFLIGEE